MTKEFTDFVLAHADDDTARLLLAAARYPDIDMPAAVCQIEGRRTAKEKWPSLLRYADFLFPPRLNREQASSERTALLKAHLLREKCTEGEKLHIADLTGGMGIDALAFAAEGMDVEYVEQNDTLCQLMQHNATKVLRRGVKVHRAESMEWATRQEGGFDAIYIDPARRSEKGQRVSAFEDCSPNILQHLPLLLSKCRLLMIKASPMIDLREAERQLGCVEEVYIVSLKGECKEVLFLCTAAPLSTTLHCICIRPQGILQTSFSRKEEQEATATYCSDIHQYIYDPDAALMKGGAFNLISSRSGLEKLSPNTHLYTSDLLLQPFAGRIFRVEKEVHLSAKELWKELPEKRAHVLTRNFPMEAAALQKKMGLKEGGEKFLIATTVGQRKRCFLCSRTADD